MLPPDDHTPKGFALPQTKYVEYLKRPVRRFAYPLYNLVVNKVLASKYASSGFEPDCWFWGQRGNDYETLRRRVNKTFPLKGKNILIAGCGAGRDVPSWLKFNLGSLTGVDFFRYDEAWQVLSRYAKNNFPLTDLNFEQADLGQLSNFNDATFDLIGSDAVFEHLKNPVQVMTEFRRILKPGGVLYATFGPLWYCWGGDHISGTDDLADGYDHLLLNSDDYLRKLSDMQFQNDGCDLKSLVEHGLFSYLRPTEYLEILTQTGYEREFVCSIIEPRAVSYLKRYKENAKLLIEKFGELPLVITGMSLIYRRPLHA